MAKGLWERFTIPTCQCSIGLDLQWEKFEEICNSIAPDSNVYDSARLLSWICWAEKHRYTGKQVTFFNLNHDSLFSGQHSANSQGREWKKENKLTNTHLEYMDHVFFSWEGYPCQQMPDVSAKHCKHLRSSVNEHCK